MRDKMRDKYRPFIIEKEEQKQLKEVEESTQLSEKKIEEVIVDQNDELKLCREQLQEAAKTLGEEMFDFDQTFKAIVMDTCQIKRQVIVDLGEQFKDEIMGILKENFDKLAEIFKHRVAMLNNKALDFIEQYNKVSDARNTLSCLTKQFNQLTNKCLPEPTLQINLPRGFLKNWKQEGEDDQTIAHLFLEYVQTLGSKNNKEIDDYLRGKNGR